MPPLRPFSPRFEVLEARDVPTYLGNQVFPADNPWNQRIADAPVAANSAAIISRIDARKSGAGPYLHNDYGGRYGMPVNVVDGTVTPAVTVVITRYAGESDIVPVPIPPDAVFEGESPGVVVPPQNRGDSHLIVYDRTANVVYELFAAGRPGETVFSYGGAKPVAAWAAYGMAVWDLDRNTFRAVGATSADAAGLPILPGLARPDEANPAARGGQGVVDHAVRMTVSQTRNLFAYPASHKASSRTDADLPRMGERFRLKSGFVIPSAWSPEAKALAQGMKEYGLIVADNGSDMFITGIQSPDWNADNARQVQQIPVGQFEVVDLTPRVTGLSVATGPTAGGTSVTVTGGNFGGAAGELHVLFGAAEAASVTILSDSQVVAVAPAGAAGAVDVRVRSGTNRLNTDGNPVFFGYGTSAVVSAGRFTYTAAANAAPRLTAVADQTVPAFGATGPVPFTVSDAETAAGSLVVTAATSDPVLLPASGVVFGGSGGNRTVAVTPAAGRSGSATVTLTVTDAGGLTAARTFAVTVTAGAAFVGTDTTTRGSWVGAYGSAGYALAAGPSSLPAGTTLAFAGKKDYLWAASTADPRALQKPGAADRLAAAWTSSGSFALDLTPPDGAARRVSVYLLDWGRSGRTETVEVLDGSTGAVLDARTATAFNDGAYLTWTVTGRVQIRVTRVTGSNALASGLFLD